MPKHIWTVLCRNVIQDKETNNLSLIGTLEEVAIEPEQPIPDEWELDTVGRHACNIRTAL